MTASGRKQILADSKHSQTRFDDPRRNLDSPIHGRPMNAAKTSKPDDVLRRTLNTPPTPRKPTTRRNSSKGRGPNKPTYKGRRLARPSSRGRK
jgi:hypothetical protein